MKTVALHSGAGFDSFTFRMGVRMDETTWLPVPAGIVFGVALMFLGKKLWPST